MKYIITELQHVSLKRRLDLIDSLINEVLSEIDVDEYNYNDFCEEVAWRIWDRMSNSMSSDLVDVVIDYIRKRYWEKIEDYYFS